MKNVYDALADLSARGDAGVLVTIVETRGSSPADPGAKLLVDEGGPVAGTVGGGPLESAAIEEAKLILGTGGCRLKKYTLGEGGAAEASENTRQAAEDTGMLCGGGVTLFFEYLTPSDRVIIFGAGHVGRALVSHLGRMGRSVAIVDTRKDILAEIEGPRKILLTDFREIPGKVPVPPEGYVVVCTNTHDSDLEVLKVLYSMKARPVYVGALASEKKAATLKKLLRESVGKSLDTTNLYMPVGLDIGGRSVDEIAISIIAEIQAVKHKKTSLYHKRDGETKE